MSINLDAGSAANFVLIILAWIFSNKRVDDLHKRIDDLKDLIRAEHTATRAEIRVDREIIEEKLVHKQDK